MTRIGPIRLKRALRVSYDQASYWADRGLGPAAASVDSRNHEPRLRARRACSNRGRSGGRASTDMPQLLRALGPHHDTPPNRRVVRSPPDLADLRIL